MNGTTIPSHGRPRPVQQPPHAWLRSRFFWPLALASVLAMALYAGWDDVARRDWDGPRLHLNLTLAWVPYVAALWAVALHQRSPHARGRLWLIGLVWLAFFPNAPYLITDWLYLPGWKAELWYSIALLTVFSTCGVLLSVVSIYVMHSLVRTVAGPIGGWCVAAAAIGLGGVGVYVGRFLRLNSWNLVTKPGEVWQEVTTRLHEHGENPSPFAFSAVMTVMLLVFYLVFRSIRLGPRSREEIAL
ncbi:MAG TPA: DUF1361 domain-containing protein [Gemmataceae bacterium]|nr:DUF1361 domain-containing protein [Gemmataceae bacterium]